MHETSKNTETLNKLQIFLLYKWLRDLQLKSYSNYPNAAEIKADVHLDKSSIVLNVEECISQKYKNLVELRNLLVVLVTWLSEHGLSKDPKTMQTLLVIWNKKTQAWSNPPLDT